MHARDFEHACICQALRRVARRVTRRYEEILKPVGLSAGQFTILASLRRGPGTRVPLGRLADDLGMDRTTLTRDLKPLERRGLISSGPDERDARIRAISLTPEGDALLGRAIPLWKTAQDGSSDRLDGADWAALRQHLDRLAQ